MSDPQCAARIFVARHGEAEYETDVLADRGGSLTGLGRKQAADLADALSGERVSHVYVSSMSRSVQTGEIVAARLGVGVTVREALREFSVGSYAGQPVEPDPFGVTYTRWLAGDLAARVDGGESGAEVVDRLSAVLQEVADAHRGEAVLVISHGGVMCTALPQLASNLSASHSAGRTLANCAVVRLDVDDDGWLARSWAGEPVPT
ncbi:histidine phosphatase family protein [Nocardioides sp.]|uniref:histidine phosphatase family protein n=1 Tax=Nocardioides sp. TaxID=35761 RepID=UPI002C63CDAD|nr:histidine phosphatase family protein [Nocardioides sp.]HXH78236.1 histidine phosphatase family protein [Nocardioides sp.]